MNSFTKKEQIVILIVVFIIILSLSFKFLIKDMVKPSSMIMDVDSVGDLSKEDNGEYIPGFNEDEDKDKDKEIMIHISGQVYSPGIIRLEPGKRLVDAVELAGGLKKDADLDKMNLAKKLLDEEKIYIPKIGEEINSDIDIDIGSMESTAANQSNGPTKVNINTSTKEELITLPGIGEVIANRVIDYRLGKQFKSIDDIKSVSGIGDKKFEGIKELITVK